MTSIEVRSFLDMDNSRTFISATMFFCDADQHRQPN